MSRKLLFRTSVLFALAALVGATFTFASSAAPSPTSSTTQPKASGLTTRGIVNAHGSFTPSSIVTMAPQSDLELLTRAKKLGPHAADSKISLIIELKLRNMAKLKNFLDQVQNPASSIYHQWLTPEQFTARYGPSKAEVTQVISFLKGQGISVKRVSSNRTLIYTVAATRFYEHAFGIRIDDYKLDGRRFYSTTDSPGLPRVVAPLVADILGLNHGVRMHPLLRVKPLAVGMTTKAPPSASSGYFNPHQIAKAYAWPDIANADNAADVSIAILTALTSNVANNPHYHDFWNAFGLPDHSINVIPIGGVATNTGGAVETALDIEWSGAMAPGATLNVYVAADGGSDTFTAMYNRMVTDNNSEIMTTSWGLAEAAGPVIDRANEQIFMEAAAQGISMFAASGDAGASDCSKNYCPPGYNNADFPSSSKYITAANGTDLTIADLDGTYGSERAWYETGGAISHVFEKPVWQRGPGVPVAQSMRMNSDIALNAGIPYLVLLNGPQGLGYYGIGGTSAVAPILAGLFAIGVSRQPGNSRLGQSNSLLYYDVLAGYYTSDFHDITKGCNGYLPDGVTFSCAQPNWDHPTGWGSPKATSLLSHLGVHGPAGTLKGTVTDATTGTPVTGVTVTVSSANFNRVRITESDGRYSMPLPSGEYTVTAGAFGYTDGTASVKISDGQATTHDIALKEAPKATISGKVTDGSGHGYGLYAEIKVSVKNLGQVADVWTDPATGQYSMDLPKGHVYTLDVAATLDGYNTAATRITLSSDTTKNFALPVTDTCSAPGYSFVANGFSEDFNGVFPPAGWKVVNDISGSPVIWKLNSDWGRTNWTGGTGTAADSDSDNARTPGGGIYSGNHDTSLVTPPIPISVLSGGAVLRYKANFQKIGWDNFDLDISTDNGSTWITLVHWVESHGGFNALPGENVKVALAPHVPAGGSFKLRWRNYDTSGYGWNLYAQIDDVVIGACKPLSGGLVMGQVNDANTGDGVVGARIADENGVGSKTIVNTDDPNLPVGFYLFFDKSGAHELTASSNHYSSATVTVTLKNNAVIRHDFTLKAARLKATPGVLTLHVMVNNSATASFALKNIGAGQGIFKVLEVNLPPPLTSSETANAAIVRMPVKKPELMNASPLWIRANANRKGHAFTVMNPAISSRSGSAWEDIAPYPVPIAGNTAARDPATGKVYSMGGFSDAAAGRSAYVYDPVTNVWSPIADAPVARLSAVSAFFNGKYYVVNGWDDSPIGDPVAELDVYDPYTNTWSTGTPNPFPAGGGSAYALMNDSLYIVGGCNNGGCTAPLSTVEVYHFSSDSWSSATNYPIPIDFASCGAIKGKLYCAGGIGGGDPSVVAGYVYDPDSNRWSAIANMPDGGYAGSFYTGADGLLLVAAGFVNIAISNQAVAYDPETNTWMDMQPVRVAAARGAHACGLYKLGGATAISFNMKITRESEVLPGYTEHCGVLPGIPWLTVAPTSGTLRSGSLANVTLAFDGTGQKEFTNSKVYFSVANNTPYGPLIVPLTVAWDPQPVGLTIMGSANPDPVRKGGDFTYTLTVKNARAANHGAATQTALTYRLPNGISYIASNGDANCAALPKGSSSKFVAATVEPPSGKMTCDFGTLAQGASKTVTIAVKAEKAGRLTSHFEVTAREPDDLHKNALDLTTTVIGTADVGASIENAALTQGNRAACR